LKRGVKGRRMRGNGGMREERGSLGRGKGGKREEGDKSPAWSSQDLGSTVQHSSEWLLGPYCK